MTHQLPPLGDRPDSWSVESSQDLHRDDWVVALRADRVRRPAAPGEPAFRRLVLEHPGAAVVLAIDDDDRVLCLRQYRHPVRRELVQLPAGLCDVPGEDPEQVARRELREEAALAAGHWTHLMSTWSSPGISAEMIHAFVARDLAPVDRSDVQLEHEEAEMAASWIPFAQLYDAVLDGRVADAPLVVAVLTHAAHRRDS